ncbi:ATP-binding protein [Pectinatus haikarae]|uniref:SpoVK/Ycf46/Vps4 family AAA+-type ATPase n=1 Tax=Pectinatus haikarae TaxID=349096 RepID=A0ABT9Y4T9_9FIRM|nr:ATP-binding protein [Pectinatus haikarae]MDQ0202851.1 SpoVK/Ycf46/Vps4 family AAA+-type ATPase [Pectinatus haikarae]
MPIGREINSNYDKQNSDRNAKRISPEPIFVPQEPIYSLEDIILPDNVKEQIFDIADYAKNSDLVFKQWGLEKTHKHSKRVGINLYGAPGTGKTMAAHAIARYLGRKILVVNYADIESKYVGETPKNIKKVFEIAQKTKSILFFDEADAILSKRVTNMTNATDVSVNQTRSVMLMILNDYQDFIIFATNFIENFDPAFMRRISVHAKFELPDCKCRRLLWNFYIPDIMPNNIDIEEIANKYEGLSGSDISNAVLTGAFKAARQHAKIVDKEYIYKAIENILSSKEANGKNNLKTEKRAVSEEYAKNQIERIRKER